MLHLSPGGWLLAATDPREDRDRSHRIAMREARIATDDRQNMADDLALARTLAERAKRVAGDRVSTALARPRAA
jgi:hypothetical protein